MNFFSKAKAISGEESTHAAGRFVHFLKSYIGRYAHLLRLENEKKSCAILVYPFLEIASKNNCKYCNPQLK
jgi:hypothetical protein